MHVLLLYADPAQHIATACGKIPAVDDLREMNDLSEVGWGSLVQQWGAPNNAG